MVIIIVIIITIIIIIIIIVIIIIIIIAIIIYLGSFIISYVLHLFLKIVNTLKFHLYGNETAEVCINIFMLVLFFFMCASVYKRSHLEFA